MEKVQITLDAIISTDIDGMSVDSFIEFMQNKKKIYQDDGFTDITINTYCDDDSVSSYQIYIYGYREKTKKEIAKELKQERDRVERERLYAEKEEKRNLKWRRSMYKKLKEEFDNAGKT